MDGLKKRLKRVPIARAAKRAFDPALASAGKLGHSVLAKLLPSSYRWGSPRRCVKTVHEAVEQLNKTPGYARQQYQQIYSDAALVPPSTFVAGTLPEGYVNAAREIPVHEYVATLRPARFWSGQTALISANDTFVQEASAQWVGKFGHAAFRRLRLPPVTHLTGSSVLIARGEDNYFHCLTDVLPRLQLLKEAGYSLDDFDHVLLDAPRTPFQRELYDAFGIPLSKLIDPWHPQNVHILADTLVVPTVHNRAGRWYTDFLRDRLLQLYPPRSGEPTPRRLYVSRRKAARRRVVDEDALIDLFSKRGFTPIEPSNLSVGDQVRLFRNAEAVAGPHGAGLTNILFCRPGAQVFEFRGSRHTQWVENVFHHLSGFVGLKHYLLFCEGVASNLDMNTGDLDLVVDHAATVAMLDRMEIH